MAEVTVEPQQKGTHGGARPGTAGKRARPPATVEQIQAGPQAGRLAKEQLEMDFFECLRTLPDADWREFVYMYLHRLAPITDRTKTGGFKYLQKYLKPIDLDDVMREFGSGGYRMILNRWNPLTRSTFMLREHVFDIENQDFPPKVPYGEWMDDDRNKKWLWAKPALLAAQQNAYAANGVGGAMNPAGFNPTEMFNSAVAAVKQLRPDVTDDKERESLAKMVIEQMRENMTIVRESSNPTQVLDIVDKILTAVKPQGGDAVLTLLMQQLKSADDRAAMLMQQLLNTGEKKSVVQELKEFQELRDILGGGHTARDKGATGWDVARDLGGRLLDTLGQVGQIYIMRMQGMPGAPGIPPRPPQQPGVVPQPGQQPEVVHDAQPVEMTDETKARMVKNISDQYAMLFDELTPYLVDNFHNFDGLDFREWFRAEYGNNMYRGMRSFARETIIAVIELRKKEAPEPIRIKLAELQPPEKLETFIEEFLSDTPIEDEEEGPVKEEF